MIDTVRTTQRNVKHWSSGEMGLRWTAAGMLEAEKQFRKVIGYTDLPRLAVAIERRLHLHQPNPIDEEAAIAVTSPYPIPDQGPTGRLLNALGRHSWRPAHIHVKVSADGYQPLTTQLYFRGDEFLDSDAASAVKDQLIVPLQPAGSDRGQHLTLRYDFHLAPAVR